MAQISNNVQRKLNCFEYMLDKFIEWEKEVSPKKEEDENPSISKLKAIKLNFFTAAVLSNESNLGLLRIFDKFYAMKYGHVEGDILDYCDKLKMYELQGNRLCKTKNDFVKILHEDENLIVESIKRLRSINNNLIKYSPFELVDLSHEWYSWKSSFTLDRFSNSIAINPKIIQIEPKIFILSNVI